MVIRPAHPDDIPDMLVLENRCYHGVYADTRWDRRSFKYYLSNPNSYFCVVELERKIVGYAAGILYRGKKAYLLSIAVSPAARRKRVGKAMLDWFVDESRKRECSMMFLEVSERRKSAQQLFKQAGFQVAQRVKDYYGKNSHALRMEIAEPSIIGYGILR